MTIRGYWSYKLLCNMEGFPESYIEKFYEKNLTLNANFIARSLLGNEPVHFLYFEIRKLRPGIIRAVCQSLQTQRISESRTISRIYAFQLSPCSLMVYLKKIRIWLPSAKHKFPKHNFKKAFLLWSIVL